MPKLERISDIISYLPATEAPLSADVVFFYGKDALWLFDVGSSDQAYEAILTEADRLQKECKSNEPFPVNIVLSHFHPDHMGNAARFFDFEDPDFTPLYDTEHFCYKLYVGANTFRYTHWGNVVAEQMELALSEEEKLTIQPIPACHAKGSLALTVGDITFLGDAVYPTHKGERAVYNAQLLKEEIDVLCKLKTSHFFLSHRPNPMLPKETVLRYLNCIYRDRDKNDPYITCKEGILL